MSISSKIPIIRSGVLEPIIVAAQMIGVPIEKHLLSVGLNIDIHNQPLQLISEISGWKLIQLISRKEHIEDFGIKSTMEISYPNIASMEPLLEGCLNLKELLNRFIAVVPTQTNVGAFHLREEGDTIWFEVTGVRILEIHEQIELYEIAGLIQLIQSVKGLEWRPDEIHFTFKHSECIDSSSHLNPGKIQYLKPRAAISFPRALLAHPILDTRKVAIPNIKVISEKLSSQLEILIEPLVGNHKFDNKYILDAIGCSFRTLQRGLAAEGTSYFEIVDKARFKKAQKLLLNQNLNFLDITLILGYENASSFSRSFKRWSGLSPREYRKNF